MSTTSSGSRTGTAAKARALPERVLRWDGCVNVRDLGGLPLASLEASPAEPATPGGRSGGGGETAFGVVVRSDSIRALSDEGWQALAGYGVRTAVDLRSDREVALDPPRDVPIDVRHFPVNGDQVAVVVEWPSMQEAYHGLLGGFPEQFAATVSTVARAEGPVVIHCHAGRDRTGLACGLMLRLAGVDLETIAVDHARSDEFLSHWWQPWHDEARDEETRERRRRVTEMRVNAMAEVLGEIDVRAYLLAGGASPEDLDRVVLRLRGELPDGQ